ncbi:MAG: ribose-phosphate pyrophosphokinase [Candidatus Omnitrophica bacterium]|nr:ribose-phosphate pyrophosphokinase [Candidatus Omnitrophota bacterium]
MPRDLAVFTGNANPRLAETICGHLGISLGRALVGRFPEGEINIQIQDNIRGKDLFIIQPTCSPTNDNLMELLLLIDAARRASADRITAVVPYYGYARQDRKVRPRVPISAKLVANLIVSAGADRLLTMDLHSGQIQGFFDIPVDHIYSIRAFGTHLNRHGVRNAVVVSPDVGGIKMARAYSKMLDCPLAIIDKRRDSDTQTKVMNVIGSVKGKNVVMVDDLISTGGSMAEAAHALKEEGAKEIIAVVVHPVLAGNAVEKIMNSEIERLIVSDSIPIPDRKRCSKIEVISVAPLLGDVIRRIHQHKSVSSLFAKEAVEA